MVADIIITGAIAYGLFKSRTGWRQTDRVGTTCGDIFYSPIY